MSNEDPPIISEEIISFCRELLKTDTELNIEWTNEKRSLYSYLLSKGDQSSWTKTDMYHLTGLYVAFGPQVLKMVDQNSEDDEHVFLSYLSEKYRIFEARNVPSPCIRISDIVRHFSFYVAEHLHMGRGMAFGELHGLPQCLAFSGGLDLIPSEPEWDTLIMMWKAWRSSYPSNEPEHYEPKRRYLQLVYVPIAKENKEEIMTHFNIAKPTIQQALEAIEGAVRDRLANMFYVSNGLMFLCYERDIRNYYKIFSNKELASNTVSRTLHLQGTLAM